MKRLLNKFRVQISRPSNLCLILTVRGPSYLGLTGSISWRLMPWLLTSPGHQQPWHWLYRICRSFSYWILSTCVITMWMNDTKCKYIFMFPLKNLARKGLTSDTVIVVSTISIDIPLHGSMSNLSMIRASSFMHKNTLGKLLSTCSNAK